MANKSKSIEMPKPEQKAEGQLVQTTPEEMRAQRYDIFKRQAYGEKMFSMVTDEKFTGYLHAGLCKFSPESLGFTTDKFFQLADGQQWSFADFDMILQLMVSLSPDHLKLDIQEYKAYREWLLPISQQFVAERLEMDKLLPSEFEEMESVIDRTPVSEIAGDA